jgi:hypothetical protein
MSIPTDPLTYVESLLGSIISTAFDDTPYEGQVAILNGQNDTARTVPCAIVYASSANIPSELPDWLRNYEVEIAVLVLTQAHVPPPSSPEPVKGLTDHRAVVQLVMNKLRDTAGVKAAAAAAGHLVYDVQPKSGQPDLEDSKFGTEINLTVTIALDLPPGD